MRQNAQAERPDSGLVVFWAIETLGKGTVPPGCPSADEWISKRWWIHTAEYYAALKKEEDPDRCYRWTNREDITLNEIRQSQRDIRGRRFCLREAPGRVQSAEAGSRVAAATV